MRVFISGVDTYVGAAVKKLLLDDFSAKLEETEGELDDGHQLEIVGSVVSDERPKGVADVATSDDTEKLCALARSADHIVLDTHKSVLEATKVVKALKEPFEGTKSLVLVSSLLTWSRTIKTHDNLDEEKDEDSLTERVYLPFNEQSFMSRKPSPSYLTHKTLESQVLALAHDSLCTTVIAGGILYGDKQNMLHSVFQKAWLCQQVKIPAFANGGRNFLPMIHVYDLSRAVVSALSAPPSVQYVVAVDESHPRLCEVITAIKESLQPNGSIPVPIASTEETDDMMIDSKDWVKLQCDFKFEFGGAVDPLIGDKWVCKGGFLENASEQTKEFISAMNLRPVKVVLLGAPSAGKSAMASRISKQYYVPIVNVKASIALLNEVRALEHETISENTETEDEEKGEEEKGEDNEKESTQVQRLYALADAYTNTEDMPTWLRQRLIRFMLHSPPCLNQGYVLDGLPETFQDSLRVFANSTEASELSWQEQDESKNEVGETKAAEMSEVIIEENIKPTSVVVLQANDSVLLEREMEKAAGEAHDAEQNFRERMKFFSENNSQERSETPLGFFENTCRIETIQLDTGNSCLDECMETASLYIEQGGKAFNYHPTEQEMEEQLRVKKEQSQLAEEKELRIQEAEETARKLEEEERVKSDKRRKDALKSQEDALLEIRSKPLREYLLENVMPTLSAGLVETCRMQPDDPVDFLAEYLFRNSMTKK